MLRVSAHTSRYIRLIKLSFKFCSGNLKDRCGKILHPAPPRWEKGPGGGGGGGLPQVPLHNAWNPQRYREDKARAFFFFSFFAGGCEQMVNYYCSPRVKRAQIALFVCNLAVYSLPPGGLARLL